MAEPLLAGHGILCSIWQGRLVCLCGYGEMQRHVLDLVPDEVADAEAALHVDEYEDGYGQ